MNDSNLQLEYNYAADSGFYSLINTKKQQVIEQIREDETRPGDKLSLYLTNLINDWVGYNWEFKHRESKNLITVHDIKLLEN